MHVLNKNMRVRYTRHDHPWDGWEGTLINPDNGLVRFDNGTVKYLGTTFLFPVHLETKTVTKLDFSNPANLMIEGHPDIQITNIVPHPHSNGWGNWAVVIEKPTGYAGTLRRVWDVYPPTGTPKPALGFGPDTVWSFGVNDDGCVTNSAVDAKGLRLIQRTPLVDFEQPFFGTNSYGAKLDFKLTGWFTHFDGRRLAVVEKTDGTIALLADPTTGKVVPMGTVDTKGTKVVFQNSPIERGYDDTLVLTGTTVRVTTLDGVVTNVTLA